MKRRLVLITCLVIAILLVPTTAFANYIGAGSWPTKTIPYTISSDVPSSHVVPIQVAAANWNANSVLRVPRNDTSYKIIVYAYNYGNVDWDGQSFINPDWNLTYTSGNFQLNTYWTNYYSSSQITVVAEHEFGHEFSLGHNPSNTSLMYFQSTTALANNSSLAGSPDPGSLDDIFNRYWFKQY